MNRQQQLFSNKSEFPSGNIGGPIHQTLGQNTSQLNILNPTVGGIFVHLVLNIVAIFIVWTLFSYIQNIEKSGCAKKCNVSDYQMKIYKYILYFNMFMIGISMFALFTSIFMKRSMSGGGFKMFFVVYTLFMIALMLLTLYLNHIQLSIFHNLNKPACACAVTDSRTKYIYWWHIFQFVSTLINMTGFIIGILTVMFGSFFSSGTE
jgi:hypothetical protein